MSSVKSVVAFLYFLDYLLQLFVTEEIMSYPNIFIKLTGPERILLNREVTRLASTGRIRACRRLQAIYLSDSGHTYKEICQSFDVSYRSVKGWVALYRKQGISGLLKRS
ncbi:MAG: helix-turn-helix domain-containing protein [Planctomycetes bacterium]|nr:helix-turn-helix domain-containing protein [Planctomycetota bacterium]